jgi:hypothetical protein
MRHMTMGRIGFAGVAAALLATAAAAQTGHHGGTTDGPSPTAQALSPSMSAAPAPQPVQATYVGPDGNPTAAPADAGAYPFCSRAQTDKCVQRHDPK